jgi:hypothetical protein
MLWRFPADPDERGGKMGTLEIHTVMFSILCGIVFVATFLAGDVAGIIIENRMSQRWKDAAQKIGFEFDGRRGRYPSLSQFFLPKLSRFHQRESAFSYGEVLKRLKGNVNGFDVAITDFTVWNFHTRGPLIFRGVVCLVTAEDVSFPEQTGLVKPSSIFFEGFSWNRMLRPYDFPHDKEFSNAYIVFGRPGAPPWIFGPDLRRFCVEHRRDIDVLFVSENELILVWPDKDPDRFPSLVETAVEIMASLAESVPSRGYKTWQEA